MSEAKLFSPLKVGAVTVPNRVFMAPLTRLRSIEPGDIPTPLMVCAFPAVPLPPAAGKEALSTAILRAGIHHETVRFQKNRGWKRSPHGN